MIDTTEPLTELFVLKIPYCLSDITELFASRIFSLLNNRLEINIPIRHRDGMKMHKHL